MVDPEPGGARRVLITGAGGGIGRAAAVRLASAGASLALLDVRADELQETARISEHHVPPLQLLADVGDEADVARRSRRSRVPGEGSMQWWLRPGSR